MPFPRKFESLLESNFKTVEKPDLVRITYSVCGCSKKACGWAGWTIESVCKKTPTKKPGLKSLPADDDQKCPNCGLNLFRTDATLRMSPSKDQSHEHEAVPTVPMKYVD